MSTLDNLRKAAKRWLKALRAKDSEALARLNRVYPNAPAEPGLRDVQHALALERGHQNWTSLKEASALQQARGAVESLPARDREKLVATFLEYACWDHHVHGAGAYAMSSRAAMRILDRYPDLARDSIYTAVVCGDLEEVERILAAQPEAASEPGGARGWPPLLYLCFARLDLPSASENAVAIARALLDSPGGGADPNAYYMAGSARYSALVGVAGEGEQDAAPHPQREALFRLLLERGAEPFDIQVLYNTHFHGDVLWWLELIYAHTIKQGRRADWDDPNWAMLDMGGYGPGAYFLLWIAVRDNNIHLAEWLLDHGASPNVTKSSHPKFKPDGTLHQQALRSGFTEMAELLARNGAEPSQAELQGEEAFVAACLRMDGEEVRAHLKEHREYLQSPKAMFAAAHQGRADVVAFLLDLGISIEIEDSQKQRPLHEAAGNNALDVAALLIERGAEVDPRESNWGATPLGYAVYGQKREMIELLSPHSRNVWDLVPGGNVERLRELLLAEPELAKIVSGSGETPLFWLPDDEQRAVEIVELFLAHGADPSLKTREGVTAADHARKRGLDEAARRLGVYGEELAAAPSPDLERYESIAQDLVFAYETGQTAAMRRLQEYVGRSFTWEELRDGVRRRLDAIPDEEKPHGYFAVPHARLFIARQAGFDNWAELVKSLDPREPAAVASPPGAPSGSQTADTSENADVPVEMRTTLPLELQDGVYSTTTEVWDMLIASRDGDLERVKELILGRPSLVHCDYNYMPPLHLAVREGHLEIVLFLLEHGAANPNYVTYPYKETLITVAEDRGYFAISQVLSEFLSRPDLPADIGDGGDIKYDKDETQRRFQKLVNNNALADVGALLKERPELALDETAFWGEGILMMPANRANLDMLELLIRYGARVPDRSKWGRAYYFKHYEIAVFLMDNGMNPNHMNWHRTTLLHDMAQEGDIRKAKLLLYRGADIDAVDQEFRSTPLGLAARWGEREMVAFLLDRGADPNKAGAPWAAPLAWARKKGHKGIERDLRQAGAKETDDQ